MSRALRVDYAGAFHHVTARGVARQPIFLNDDDRHAFVKRLAEVEHRWGLAVHAYCLMPNHYHLEIEAREANLSAGLKWFNHVYASFFNWRHERAGHVFQGRFKSALVEADAHLHALTRYIHLNPVRAGLAAHPADYMWSSYRAYVGMARRPTWLRAEPTLRRFGGRPGEQVRAYRAFVEEEIARNPLDDLAFGTVVGSAAFVDWVRQRLQGRKPSPDIPDLNKAMIRPTLERICALLARRYRISEDTVRTEGRKGNLARYIAVYLAREFSGKTNREIGAYFGGVTAAAVSKACSRVDAIASEDKTVLRTVTELSSRVVVSQSYS